VGIISKLSLKYKIWIDKDGKCFGDGPMDLLALVKETGSLKKAADEMGMSYSQAWHLVRSLENRLGFPLLERKTGGSGGGGSEITDNAECLMKRFGSFKEKANQILSELFEEFFGDC